MNATSTRDRGTAGVEAAIAVTGLLLTAFFLVGALRIVGTHGDVAAAAHAGARAASAARDPLAAEASARGVVVDSLGRRGVACRDLTIEVSGGASPGSVVRVDVTCTVSLADVVLAGFPGTRTVTAEAVELVDVIRGGG